MKFVCEKYPGLFVRDLGVRFVNGEATVDTRKAAALRQLPAELGIHEAPGQQSTTEGSNGGSKGRAR